MTLFIGFLIGCAFGAILFLGGATSYRRILGTLLLKDMWIIKLMMTAIGVGTLGIYLLDLGGLANMSIKPAYVWVLSLAARSSASAGPWPATAPVPASPAPARVKRMRSSPCSGPWQVRCCSPSYSRSSMRRSSRRRTSAP
jgi:hypothetical protein